MRVKQPDESRLVLLFWASVSSGLGAVFLCLFLCSELPMLENDKRVVTLKSNYPTKPMGVQLAPFEHVPASRHQNL